MLKREPRNIFRRANGREIRREVAGTLEGRDENSGELRRIGFDATAIFNRHDFRVSWQTAPGRTRPCEQPPELTVDTEAIRLDDLELTGASEYYRRDRRVRRRAGSAWLPGLRSASSAGSESNASCRAMKNSDSSSRPSVPRGRYQCQMLL